ncbi:transcription initiation factor TFIID subunit 8-like [Brachypodium distachyon]|uniref:Bromodomain associated domain-containing protein n=1 Tax=Brachypodium distachyon TaxID=15368 RepID=A0A2K2CNA0_BRADI|nr:transcription initiation factor TFIID subunit 8-like [Brachypodium distachyon]PNT63521.1 hypothetical protein BRADI_4g16985v3 [Brachypodium distachyon]|eukprot:XP_010237676.1 transcription initiation factor TFIID subunit 8-like [Brachypodium distachyon]
MGTPARDPCDAVAALAPLPVVSTISIAQILRASGYSSAESAALRALSDIAGRYITSLGRTASAIAEAQGWTESNLLDLTLALEEHKLAGFSGASDPTRPVLCSGVLSELAGFVRMVRLVPFAKLLPRMGEQVLHTKRWESFASAGKEPPLGHVPRWLPCFPEQEADSEGIKGKWELRRLVEVQGEQMVKVTDDGKEGRGVVPGKRGKVKFLIGDKKQRWVGFDKHGGGFERFVGK